MAIRSSQSVRPSPRARLCGGLIWTISQAPLAAKRPEGRWFSPSRFLRSVWHSRSVFPRSSTPVPVGEQ